MNHKEVTGQMSDGRWRPACDCGWWGVMAGNFYSASKRWLFHMEECGAVPRKTKGLLWKRTDWN